MPETPSVTTKQPSRLVQAKQTFLQAVDYMKTNQYPQAEPLLKRVLKIIPKHANSHQLLSVIAVEQGNLQQGLKSINRAIAYAADRADYYFNRAILYKKLDKYKHAIADFQQALNIDKAYYPAYCALGDLYHLLGDYENAIHYYQLSLKFVNTDEAVWDNLGAAYLSLKQYSESIRCANINLHLNPNNAKIHARLGNLYKKLFIWENAQQAYQKALLINPENTSFLTSLLICNNMLCDWENYTSYSSIAQQDYSLTPFEALSLPFSNQQQLEISQHYSARISNSISVTHYKRKFKHQPHQHKRLRIAYISSSFRDFPTGHLTQDLYASHDRDLFEVFAYSYGKDDQSIYRRKIAAGCDQFIDIDDYSIEQACQKIYDDKIDILIDLMGHTTNSRLEINAIRPAPINVRYLGAPGTSGANFFDYVISDAFITPPEVQAYYTENLVLMPHSYQVNPHSHVLSKHLPTRAECGLPQTAIVFCAFNNSYKIEPSIFSVWMNILNAVPNSILWLQATGQTQINLTCAAQQQNIAANRLVFADRQPKPQHLARHVHADLYLDTHYYNAHTTASDALWMNVPVITCPGSTFQSRVAGSLLKAIRLNELIMPDLKTYESTAIALATHHNLLQQFKQRLIDNGKTSALFDSKRFTANLEKAYLNMWENYCLNKKSLIIVPE